MDTFSGYETSLLLCKVVMGFESEKDSLSKSMYEGGTSETDTKISDYKLSSVVKVHGCDYPGCEAKFDRPWKLSAHRCIHTGERPYKCTKTGCNKSYTNLTHLRRHEQTSHVDKPPTAADGTPVIPKLFTCHENGCSLKFQTKCSLKRHVFRKHINKTQEEAKCPDCDLVFTKFNQLKSHMYTHDGIKPFKCEWCSSSFLNHNDIMSHIRKHKFYKCSYLDCPDGTDKTFITRSELKSHLAQIHPSKFSCENCDKIFSLKCRLTSHKLSCGKDSNEKPYKCVMDDCEHVFKLERNMLQHVKHKHGEPRFACTVENCGKKFIWKISYNKHIRNFHDPAFQEQRKINSGDGTEGQPKRKKKRKDANIPKQMVAEALSGVSVDKTTKLKLFKKENVDTDAELMAETLNLSSFEFVAINNSDSSDKKSSITRLKYFISDVDMFKVKTDKESLKADKETLKVEADKETLKVATDKESLKVKTGEECNQPEPVSISSLECNAEDIGKNFLVTDAERISNDRPREPGKATSVDSCMTLDKMCVPCDQPQETRKDASVDSVSE